MGGVCFTGALRTQLRAAGIYGMAAQAGGVTIVLVLTLGIVAGILVGLLGIGVASCWCRR